jgi:protein involved in polysaccharide export with SLBB domain
VAGAQSNQAQPSGAVSQQSYSSLSPAQQKEIDNYLASQNRGTTDAGTSTADGSASNAVIPDGQVLETQVTEVSVFGQSLFKGAFSRQSFKGFNPDYIISVGDNVDVRLWGIEEADIRLSVDAQGNIFLPKVGPIRVAGVPNVQLNETVTASVRKLYRSDVGVYASLATAVPVKVYVSGFVVSPGLYAGFSSDSPLNFLDRAGGVNPVSGSYIDVRVLRGGSLFQKVNLYDFLTKGYLPPMQLHDGDSIFVGPIGPTVRVSGLVSNPVQFEFTPPTSVASVLGMAGVNGRATNVRVIRNSGVERVAFYVGLGDAKLDQPLAPGDEIEVTADRPVGSIAVTVEGEHRGSGQYVLPYNATLNDLLQQVVFTDQSQRGMLQLYRRSVAARQKEVLDEMLDKLEQSALSARSGTSEEAALRTQEASLMLQFIDRARLVVPKGQVVLPQGTDPARIALEDGDVIRIPRLSNLVEVHGEVFLPNAYVWRRGQDVGDYLRQAGGVVQKSAEDRVLLMRPSGEIVLSSGSSFFGSAAVQPGDEILLLPAVDTKNFQFAKDITQVLYQVAIAASVVLRYN